MYTINMMTVILKDFNITHFLRYNKGESMVKILT